MNTGKHDMHRLDRIVKVLESKAVIIFFAVCMAIAGVVLSVVNSEWLWFSRFGSLITVAGLLLISSPSFLASDTPAVSLVKIDDSYDNEVINRKQRKVGSETFTGIIISIMGTVVWGFGDLIGQIS